MRRWIFIKDLKNCKIDNHGNITMKMIKMGMDIDETRNHRIRGIVPTDDGKFVFIEILQGEKPKFSYTNLSKSEYEKEYPYQEYIWIDGCFRVDIPEDKFRCYSKEYQNFDRKSFRNLKHTKENIVKLLQKFNKNIMDLELVDDYYLDEFNREHGFYRLYDNRLDHKQEALEIKSFNNNYIKIKEKYSCYNYNHSVLYEEIREEIYKDYDLDELYNIYGKEKLDGLIENYKEQIKSIHKGLEK